MIYIIVLLPFLAIFLSILLLRDLFKASLITYLITLFISFIYGVYFHEILIANLDSLFTAFRVFLLVFSLLLLFKIVEKENKSFFLSFKQKNFLVFITIGVFLTILLEGLVGFGTPGMICTKTLYNLNFNPVLSASVSLISDSYSTFGAFATPIIIGNKDLESLEFVKLVGYVFSILAFFILFSSYFLYTKLEKKENINFNEIVKIIIAFSIFSLIVFAISRTDFFVFTIIFAALGAIIYLFIENVTIFKNFLKVFYPFFISIIAFVFLKFLNVELINKILSNFNIAPIVLLISLILIILKEREEKIKIYNESLDLLNKSLKLFLIIFFLSFLSSYLTFSGRNSTNSPSVLDIINQHLVKIDKDVYFFIAPLIGIFGAFIFGSATLSNLTFVNIQKEIAIELGLDVNKIVALQNIGAGLGNMISLFNIIAITTMIDELKGKEIEILKINFVLVILFFFISSLIIYLL
ncbi:MAG: L-lactate permease [Candidatus Aenigmatarchaeota archaeon]